MSQQANRHTGAGSSAKGGNMSRSHMEKERLARVESGANKTSSSNSLTPIKAYLVLYNLISTLLWGYILVLTITHFTAVPPSERHAKRGPLSLSRILQTTTATLPHTVSGYIARLSNAGSDRHLKEWTIWVQTLAALEVVHALLGWVRSGVGITAAQVASRLWTVWVVMARSPKVAENPLFSTMVFAWSLAEVIRYSFYATQLLGFRIPGHNYLRYTLFIVLYPLGASSEALLSFSTLPPLFTCPLIPNWVKELSPMGYIYSRLPTSLATRALKSPLGRRLIWNMAKAKTKAKVFGTAQWGTLDYACLVLFFVWWPSLYVLMSHMFVQRRKVLGPGRRVGEPVKVKVT
ncbi:tyrosine phosphatase-like protein [Kockovaella imperatae]|uniref:Very-long-chain (3R)-3-hydroxyacyl-CoA dehydratase n=1 Tax=Kockovaella imperatae TaxID=4999 RepID=A0A1Y1ULQ8_9TREE|nr:tyrosine phosphatase-like protein [Kockovaella imperatae]ORX38055.1 tyrosine phosphatase-like protein [Kockovaella imperatae]